MKHLIQNHKDGLTTIEEACNQLIDLADAKQLKVMDKVVPLLSVEELDYPSILSIFEGFIKEVEKAEKEGELTSIKTELLNLAKDYGTMQENAHRILIRAVIYCWKERDCEVIKFACKTLDDVSGSFRIEAITYWLQHVAGLAVTYSDKEGWGCSFCNKAKSKPKYISALGIDFTYDKAHLSVCKEDNNRFWKVVPKTPKILKLPEPEKVFTGSIAQLARLLAINPGQWDNVSHVIDGLKDAIVQESKSAKTREWVDAFILSNPSLQVEEEVSQDELDRIASLEE